jgi:transposase
LDRHYQQARRWIDAGVFEQAAHDLRIIIRLVCERDDQPSATIFDGRTIQSTPESGGPGGYDGAKETKGSKMHIAVDTLGNLLALKVTGANEQERAQVADLASKVQEITGGTVQVAFVDQGYTGENAAGPADAHGIRLEAVSTRRRRRGSWCCRAGGWWSERSAGWVGFGGWRGNTSVSRVCYRASIGVLF